MKQRQAGVPTGRMTKDFAFDVKAVTDEGVIEGYASTFGNVDSAGDVIAPGAFTRTLAAWRAKGRPVPVLWQHDAYDPIGVTTSIEEDDKGLRVTAKLVTEVARARDAHALAKAGALGGLSIGFSVPAIASDGQPAIVWDEEQRAAVFREVRLWEYSLVTFPANEEAVLTSVKSVVPADLLDTLKDIREHLAADRTREVVSLLREVKHAIVAASTRSGREPIASAALTDALKQANAILRATSATP